MGRMDAGRGDHSGGVGCGRRRRTDVSRAASPAVRLAVRDRQAALSLALVFVPALSAAETVDVWSRPERRPPVRTYDVRHYRIALRLEDDTRSFRGETEVTLAPLQDG